MQKIICIAVVLFVFVNAKSQTAFYDANKIYKWFNTDPSEIKDVKTHDTIAAIILKYSVGGWESITKNSTLLGQYQSRYMNLRYANAEELLNKILASAGFADIKDVVRRKKLEMETAKLNFELTSSQLLRLQSLVTYDLKKRFIDSLRRYLPTKFDLLYSSRFMFRNPTSDEDLFFNDVLIAIRKLNADTTSVSKKQRIATLESTDIRNYPNPVNDFLVLLYPLRDSVDVVKLQAQSLFYDHEIAKINVEYSRVNDAAAKNSDSLQSKFKEYVNNLKNTLTPGEVAALATSHVILDNHISEKSSLDLAVQQVVYDQSNLENKQQQTDNLANPIKISSNVIIDAAAILLVNKMKMEAIIYFSKLLQNNLGKYPFLKISFANTLRLLEKWDGVTAPDFGTRWRYEFSKDLTMLPETTILFCREQNFIPAGSASEVYLDAFEIALKIKDRYNFLELIESVYQSGMIKSEKLRSFISLTNMINNELYEKDAAIKRYWINFRDFESMTLNNDQFKLFLSLVLEKYPDLKTIFSIGADDINGTTLSPKLINAAKRIRRLLIALNHFQTNQNVISAAVGNKDFNLISYWTMFSDIIEQAIGPLSYDPANTQLNNDIKVVMAETKNVFEIYNLIQEKNYGASASLVLQIVEEIINRNATVRSVYQDQLKFASKVIDLISNIMAAKNSQELSKVIENSALPPASYRIRNVYNNSIDLGAYVGGYLGNEFVQSPPPGNGISNPGLVYGLSAPIGINFNKGFSKAPDGDNIRRSNYWNFSITLIDIGAVVSYRFTEADSTPLPSNINWAQIFSPGIFFHPKWGLDNSPLVWSFGVQYAPKLRTIDKVSELNAIRFSFGIAFDLPLLMLHKGSPVIPK